MCLLKRAQGIKIRKQKNLVDETDDDLGGRGGGGGSLSGLRLRVRVALQQQTADFEVTIECSLMKCIPSAEKEKHKNQHEQSVHYYRKNRMVITAAALTGFLLHSRAQLQHRQRGKNTPAQYHHCKPLSQKL